MYLQLLVINLKNVLGVIKSQEINTKNVNKKDELKVDNILKNPTRLNSFLPKLLARLSERCRIIVTFIVPGADVKVGE